MAVDTQAQSTRKLAIVTGANRGIGRATALHLAGKGVDVILTYRERRNEADAVVKEIQAKGCKAVALQLDSSAVASFADFTGELRTALGDTWNRERLDFLINNAGVGAPAPFADTSEAMFDEMANIHLKGVYFLTQALLPLIADGGRILNLSSGLARFTAPGWSAYAAMKGGVEVLTRYLALELGPRRITVNCVAPGATATDFGGGAIRDNPGINAHIASITALGRTGGPDDIGAMIAALLSEDGRWVNGQRIEVSGGVNL